MNAGTFTSLWINARSQRCQGKLEALGITTLEELKAHWFYENRELLTAYLGDTPLNLVAIKPPAGTCGAWRSEDRVQA